MKIPTRSSFLLLPLAIILGLALPEFSPFSRPLLEIALVIMMTVSTTKLSFAELANPVRNPGRILAVIGVNYGLLTAVIIAASYSFVTEPALRIGFLIMAAMPPAISVIPYSRLLDGNLELAVFGSGVLYLLSLILTPLLLYLFAGSTTVTASALLLIVGVMIVLPLALSRLLARWRTYQKFEPYSEHVVNVCFFIIIYSVIGLNSEFFKDPSIVLIASLVGFSRTFVSGGLTGFLLRFFKTDNRTRTTYILFGSYKNLGLSATVSISVFGARASVPAAISMPFEVGFFLLLLLRHRDSRDQITALKS